MRSAAPDFALRAASSVAEATQLLAQGPWRAFAGGTDIMVLFEAGMLQHRHWLSLWSLDELRRIEVTDRYIDLGCLVTYTQIQTHPLLKAEFPCLGMAASETGSIAIQNRGTIGGNIANASPAADSPPALLAYEAALKLTSSRGERWVPYTEFHLGYKKTALQPGELLTTVRLPRVSPDSANRTTRHYFRKVGTRGAQAISKVVAAGVLELVDHKVAAIRWAVGSVGPTTARCAMVENFLKNQLLNDKTIALASAELAHELSPIDDIRSTRVYRQTVAGNLLREFLLAAKAAAN